MVEGSSSPKIVSLLELVKNNYKRTYVIKESEWLPL